MTREDRTRHLRALAAQLVESYLTDGEINRSGEKDLPAQEAVQEIVDQLLALLFPGYRGRPVPLDADLELLTGARLDRVGRQLDDMVERTLRFCHRSGCNCEELWEFAGEPVAEDRFAAAARKVTAAFLGELPAVIEAAAEHSSAMGAKYEAKVAELMARPENVWMEGLSAEEAEALRKAYAERYNQ